MSDTPRTDAEAFASGWPASPLETSCIVAVPATFARQLERELAEARTELATLREMLQARPASHAALVDEIVRLRRGREHEDEAPMTKVVRTIWPPATTPGKLCGGDA